MKHTPEHKALVKALMEVGGVSRSGASRLINKRVTPSLFLAVKLEDELNIPVRGWLDKNRMEGLP